jgi:hypothetical protein
MAAKYRRPSQCAHCRGKVKMLASFEDALTITVLVAFVPWSKKSFREV